MIRSIPVLALAVFWTASASAQRPGHGPPGRPHAPVVHGTPQPIGVIQPPTVPFVGSNATPSPVPPIQSFPRRHFRGFPGFAPWGFYPGYWPLPDIYDAEPFLPVTPPAAQFAASPVYVVPAAKTVVQDSPPPTTRARLTLDVPPGAQVWLAGKPVDTAALPVVLESPSLEPSQRYNFDLRVTWHDSSGDQERKRTVTVGAGESKSLTYASAGP